MVIKIVGRVWASKPINSFDMTVIEYEAKDTGKSFMFDGKRLDKGKMGKIDYGIYKEDSAYFSSLSVYCFPHEEDIYKKKIVEGIKAMVEDKLESIKRQLEFLENGYREIRKQVE